MAGSGKSNPFVDLLEKMGNPVTTAHLQKLFSRELEENYEFWTDIPNRQSLENKLMELIPKPVVPEDPTEKAKYFTQLQILMNRVWEKSLQNKKHKVSRNNREGRKGGGADSDESSGPRGGSSRRGRQRKPETGASISPGNEIRSSGPENQELNEQEIQRNTPKETQPGGGDNLGRGEHGDSSKASSSSFRPW